MSKKRSHEEEKIVHPTTAELNGTKRPRTRGNAASTTTTPVASSSPVKKGQQRARAPAKSKEKAAAAVQNVDARSDASGGTVPTDGQDDIAVDDEDDEEVEQRQKDSFAGARKEEVEEQVNSLEGEVLGKAPPKRKKAAPLSVQQPDPKERAKPPGLPAAATAFTVPAPKVPSSKATSPKTPFLPPTIENISKWSASSNVTPNTPSSMGSESPATDKYRKYRMKQKEKFVDLQRELDEARQEVERHREKERKLLYLLLISHKQVTIRDEELARLNLELEKYKVAAGKYEEDAPAIVQGLISLSAGNNAAPSPYMPNRKRGSTLLAMRMPSLSESQPSSQPNGSTQPPAAAAPVSISSTSTPTPAPSTAATANSQPAQGFKRGPSSAQWPGGEMPRDVSFDLGIPSLSDMPNFGDELLERVMPEGKEEEMENAFISSLIYDDIAQERFRQRSQFFRTQSMTMSQQISQLFPPSSQSSQPQDHGAARTGGEQQSSLRSANSSVRMGSVDQLITADQIINADENAKAPSGQGSEAEKLAAGYYSQLFKKA